MKKAIRVLLVILLLNVGFNHLLRSVIDINNFEMYYSLKIVSKSILLALTVYYIVKSKINLGLYSYNKISIIISLIAFFISFNYVSRIIDNENLSIPLLYNILFFVSCLFVALFEEYLIRVFLFENLYPKVKSDKYSLIYPIVVVSAVFGIVHITNVLNPNTEIMPVFIQIVFAFAIGIFFQSILVRFNSIIVIVTIHTIINYIGMFRTKLFKHNIIDIDSTYSVQDFISSLVFMLVLALFFFLISFMLLRKQKYNSKILS